MTTSYAELGETCVAATRAEAVRPTQPKAAQLGIVVFFCTARHSYVSPSYANFNSVWCPNFIGRDLGAMEVADMLIGMDVISMGDFKLINDGKTSFSIRTPSEGDAPFVADTQEAVQ